MEPTQIQENLAKMLEVTLEMTIKESLPDTSWFMKRGTGIDDFGKSHCIVLTVSSFRFRVMLIMHLNFDDHLKQFLASLMGAKLHDLDEEQLTDRLLELSNSFCGHVKRHLQDTCPQLGMSTPNLLDSACLDMEGVLDIAYQAHVKANDNAGDDHLFGATAFVSLLDDSDFEISQPQMTQSNGEMESFGELELF